MTDRDACLLWTEDLTDAQLKMVMACKGDGYAKYRASGARLRRPAPLRGSGPSGLQSTFAGEI